MDLSGCGGKTRFSAIQRFRLFPDTRGKPREVRGLLSVLIGDPQ